MASTSSLPSIAAPAGAGAFTRFAWSVLAWNLVVILWGAVVRATGSGAGCGSHWPLCNGEVIPPTPAMATVIEFTHRLTSGVALLGVGAMWVWARKVFPRGHAVRRFAFLSVLFILIEAALGAGLVLFNYVEKNASGGRALYLSAHLVNTQILLAVITLTAWKSRGAAEGRYRASALLRNALPVALIVAVTGAIAALGDTLFPASSVAEGMRQDVSPAAHFLVQLRGLHPLIAILAAVYISFAVIAVRKSHVSALASKLAMVTWGILAVQLVVGAVNILLLAPVWMQVLHLLVANLLWIALVLMVVEGSRELPARHGV